jgi:hypothetical protein
MSNFYVSLVEPLCGYYLRAQAENELHIRQWANKKLGRLWCSVYEPKYIESQPHFDIAKVIGPRVVLTMEDGELYDNYY